MTAKDSKQKITDNCPKQEADIQDTCSPCDATECDAEEDPCE
jgi:hypothetical protein